MFFRKKSKNQESTLEQCFKYLQNNLRRLASSYEVQNAEIEDFARWNLPDDIASDWCNHAYFTARLLEAGIINDATVSKFENIANAFLEASLGGNLYEEIIWEHEGLQKHLFWELQRQRAKELLKQLENVKW